MKFLIVILIYTFSVFSFKQKEQNIVMNNNKKNIASIEDQFLNEISKKPKDFLRSYFSDLKRFSSNTIYYKKGKKKIFS